ncbi:cupin domain-containing protein [Galbibacter sp. EGI 63066]|uniref:cupin domain-containing protein n=1 Tax=Galbibacter sp. EGI 63066 TaxID=2993559 RepID=UPI0022490D9E|nr:cupin domain-containing protein [Galbibacter sp. EGI 63066]MCX2678911.1 cupin domain-containing protein [Galbibacter sp. EGI 63066]
MKNAEFEESITFNLADVIEFSSNAIVVKNIKVEKACVIQVFAFDFGKVLPQKKSPFTQFIHIIEGRAEVVINNNSTFMHSGDFILIPAYTTSSIEANHKFKMICTTIKSK